MNTGPNTKGGRSLLRGRGGNKGRGASAAAGRLRAATDRASGAPRLATGVGALPRVPVQRPLFERVVVPPQPKDPLLRGLGQFCTPDASVFDTAYVRDYLTGAKQAQQSQAGAQKVTKRKCRAVDPSGLLVHSLGDEMYKWCRTEAIHEPFRSKTTADVPLTLLADNDDVKIGKAMNSYGLYAPAERVFADMRLCLLTPEFELSGIKK